MDGPREMGPAGFVVVDVVDVVVVAVRKDCWPAACFRSVDRPLHCYQYAKANWLVSQAVRERCSESCSQAVFEAGQLIVAARTDSMMWTLSSIVEAPKTPAPARLVVVL